jgi:hypothetical protein
MLSKMGKKTTLRAGAMATLGRQRLVVQGQSGKKVIKTPSQIIREDGGTHL